jgi:hypothetical protein
MADPTLTSLELFKDASHWDRIEENVPIFVEHSAYDKDKNLLYTVDKAKLDAVAAEINRLYDEDGCAIKIFDGHTKPAGQVAQKDQPQLLGYGVHATVGKFGKSQKHAVLLTKVYYHKGTAAIVADRPERSPEFYPETGRVKAVALLKTDPKLNMGMTIYNTPEGQLTIYGINYWDDAAQPVDQDPTVVPKSAAEERADQEIDEKEKSKFTKYMKHCYPKVDEQYGMGMAFPSAMNTSLPKVTMSEDKTPVAAPAVATPNDFNAEMASVKYAQQEARLVALEAKNLRLECEAKVRNLVTKGKRIPNPENEVKYLMALADEPARMARCEEIVNCYQDEDDPTRVAMIHVAYGEGETTSGESAISQLTPSEINHVVRYCESNKLDYEVETDRAKAVSAVLASRRNGQVRRPILK